MPILGKVTVNSGRLCSNLYLDTYPLSIPTAITAENVNVKLYVVDILYEAEL